MPASTPTLSSSASSQAAVWYLPAMASLAGQIGVITVVDMESDLARVQFVHSETSSVSEWWLPIPHLLRADRDSDAWVGLEKLSDVRSQKALDASAALCNLYARKAVLSIMTRENEADRTADHYTTLVPTASKPASPAASPRSSAQSVKYQDILQLISAELLPPLSLQDTPTLPASMVAIVRRALLSEASLPSVILSDVRRVVVQNSAVACSNDGGEEKDWDEEAKAIVTSHSRALILSFHHSTRLPKPADTLLCFSNPDLSKLLKQWRGGEKATPLLPVLLPSSSVWLSLKREKAASRSTTVKLEANGVPEKLSLALYVVDYVVRQLEDEDDHRKMANGASTKSHANGAVTDWVSTLLAALSSLSVLLSAPALSTLIKQSVFHVLIRALSALHRRRALPPSLELLPCGLLYEEMLDLHELAKKDSKDAKVTLVSVYLQSLIELLSVLRRAGGERAFAKAIADHPKGGKSSAGLFAALGLIQRKSRPVTGNSSASATSSSSSASRVSPIKAPILKSPTSSQPSMASPQSAARGGRGGPLLSPLPSSSPASASSSSSSRTENAERQLREMLAAVGNLKTQMANLSSSSAAAVGQMTSISMAPFSPSPASSSTSSSSSASTSASSTSPAGSSGFPLGRLPSPPGIPQPAAPQPSPASSSPSSSLSPSVASTSSSVSASSSPPVPSRPSPRRSGHVEQLVHMGFDAANAEAAIVHFGFFSAALDALMSGWQEEPRPSAAPEAAASPASSSASSSAPASSSATASAVASSTAAAASTVAASLHPLSISPSVSQPSAASSSAPVPHSPANSFASLGSSLPSPLLPSSREVSVPESVRSELSSSMSLDSGMMSAESARMRVDEAASGMSVDDLSDEERGDDEEEDEAEALVRAISLSLAANQAEQKVEDEEKERERKEDHPTRPDADAAKDTKEPIVRSSPTLVAEEKKPQAAAPPPVEVTPLKAAPSSSSATAAPAAPAAVVSPAVSHIATEAWFDSFCLVSDLLDALFTAAPSVPAYIAEEAVQLDDAEVQRLQEEHPTWTRAADAELIRLANTIEELGNLRLASTDDSSKIHQHAELRKLIAASELQSLFHLRGRSHDSLTRRLLLFRLLNVHLMAALPLIDLSRSSSSDSTALAHRLSYCRNLLFSSLKFELLDALLELTTREKPTSKPRVLIDRQAAAASMQKDGAQSVFMQSFRQLKDIPVVQFLQPVAKGQTYTVIDIKFKGEHVVGEGGPYRQLFNDISRELQAERIAAAAGLGSTAAPYTGGGSQAAGSGGEEGVSKTVLPLFVPSANRQVAVGENRDKFVPVPSSCSSVELGYFEFFGKLLGIAIRTGVLMPLDLSSFFFKPLVSQQLTMDDLEGIDASFVHGVLDQIRQLKEDDVAAFAAHFGDSLTWSTTLSDQSSVELRPGGAAEPVDFAERHAFAALALQARLNESRAQLKAIHRGLTALIPDPLLSLMTWAELERRVCGTPTIDIELLKRHTEYSGCSASSAHVQYFWRVLSDMSQADRRKFVAFCSGSERLPSSDEEFNRGGQRVRLLIKDYSVKAAGNENVDARYMRSDTWYDHSRHCTHPPMIAAQ